MLSEVDNNHESTGDYMEDICDGQFLKAHPIFRTDKHALLILAYYDDIEVANPLGSKATKHKLGILSKYIQYITL